MIIRRQEKVINLKVSRSQHLTHSSRTSTKRMSSIQSTSATARVLFTKWTWAEMDTETAREGTSPSPPSQAQVATSQQAIQIVATLISFSRRITFWMGSSFCDISHPVVQVSHRGPPKTSRTSSISSTRTPTPGMPILRTRACAVNPRAPQAPIEATRRRESKAATKIWITRRHWTLIYKCYRPKISKLTKACLTRPRCRHRPKMGITIVVGRGPHPFRSTQWHSKVPIRMRKESVRIQPCARQRGP